MWGRAAFVSWLLWAGACGDDSAPPDASVSDGAATWDAGALVAPPEAPAAPEDPTPPTEPAPPRLTPCPEGWSESTSADGDVTCEPWPAEGPGDCATHEHHLPGAPACAPVGAPCPADGRPTGFPAGATVVWVEAGAVGGDGTPGRPFGTVGEGLAGASSGDIVAVAEGSYSEAVVVPAGVALWGACPERTVLRSTAASSTVGVVHTTGLGAVVRDVTIGPSARPGLSVRGATAALGVRGVAVRGVTGLGVHAASGGRVDAVGVAIRDVTAAPDGTLGYGNLVQDGASATLRDVTIVSVPSRAVLAGGTRAATVDAARLSVRDVGGRGVVAADGSTVALRQCAIEEASDVAAIAFHPGTALLVEDCVVRDTRARPLTFDYGDGLAVTAGAQVTARRTTLERNREAGAVSSMGDTTLRLEDVVVRDTASRRSDLTTGIGALAYAGGALSLERVALRRSRANSVLVIDPGSSGTLADVVATETASNELDGRLGRGINAENAESIALARVRVEDCREAGVASAGVAMELEDVTIRRVLPTEADGRFGRGLGAQLGATADGARILIEDVAETAVLLEGDVAGSLVDVAIGGTGADEGRGVALQSGLTATLERVRVERSGNAGIFLHGASATIRDLVVTDGAEAGADAGGQGIHAIAGASASVERARLARTRSFAVLASGSTLSLSDALIEDVAPALDGRFGRAVASQLGATVDLTRATVARTGDFALFATSAGSTLTATDVDIDEGRGDGRGGFGFGVGVYDSASVELARVRSTRARGVGVAVMDAALVATDVEVRGVRPFACADTTCVGEGAGTGVIAYAEGTARLERFSVADSAQCGVQVARDGALDLRTGEVRGSLIGACVQVDGYDVGRLTEGVTYVDNGTNLQATTLPLPDAGDPGEELDPQ